MNPLVRLRQSWLLTLAAALPLLFGLASPASASPETLKRSVTNILFGPLDVVLGPVTGSRSVYNNIQDIEDTTGVRIAFAVPGVAWNSAMQMGGGVLRTFTGLLEFLPGLILLPFEADMDPLFTMPERQDALIDEEYDFIAIKIGVNYVD
jgi:hypothetical protein